MASFVASIGEVVCPGGRQGRQQGRHPYTRSCLEDMVEVLGRASERVMRLGIAEGCYQTDAQEESQTEGDKTVRGGGNAVAEPAAELAA
jgi:hypothetical protein